MRGICFIPPNLPRCRETQYVYRIGHYLSNLIVRSMPADFWADIPGYLEITRAAPQGCSTRKLQHLSMADARSWLAS